MNKDSELQPKWHEDSGFLSQQVSEDSELLLQQFFSEATQQQIADDGFSHRVMQQLPSRTNWAVRLWTWFCIVVFAALFVCFRGWEQLALHLAVTLRTMTVQPFSINLLTVAVVFFSLLFVGLGEVIASETDRRWFAAR